MGWVWLAVTHPSYENALEFLMKQDDWSFSRWVWVPVTVL
jgi:hypothetical protein